MIHIVSYIEKNDNLCHDAFDVFYKAWPENAEQIVIVVAINPNDPKWTQMETQMNTNICNS